MVSNPHSPEECETENVKELGESKRTLCLPFAKVRKTERGCLEIEQFFEGKWHTVHLCEITDCFEIRQFDNGDWQTVHLCDFSEITQLIEGIVSVFARVPRSMKGVADGAGMG